MLKLVHEQDLIGLDIPKELKSVIQGYLFTLDSTYGKDRESDNSDGGYVVLLEPSDSINMLKDIDLDVDKFTPEYTEIIKLADGRQFSNTLCLFNNEFGVSFIMPIDLTPTHFLEC